MMLKHFEVERLKNLVNQSLDRIYSLDRSLTSRTGMEQAIAFRFGLYFYDLAKQMPSLSGYDIDMEYNKNGVAPKDTPSNRKGTRPDFIIHGRGHNCDNLLIVEFKIIPKRNFMRHDTAKQRDLIKLSEFTQQSDPHKYKYGLGIFVELGPDFFACEAFIDGSCVCKWSSAPPPRSVLFA